MMGRFCKACGRFFFPTVGEAYCSECFAKHVGW